MLRPRKNELCVSDVHADICSRPLGRCLSISCVLSTYTELNHWHVTETVRHCWTGYITVYKYIYVCVGNVALSSFDCDTVDILTSPILMIGALFYSSGAFDLTPLLLVAGAERCRNLFTFSITSVEDQPVRCAYYSGHVLRAFEWWCPCGKKSSWVRFFKLATTVPLSGVTSFRTTPMVGQ